MKWFRFYSEALDDPKVQKLRPELFKFWVNLLCLANAGSPRGTLPSLDDMALRMRIRRDHLDRFIAALEAAKLLVRDGSDALKPHNWDSRQPASDDINSRVKRYRETNYEKQQEANVTLHARSKSVTNAGADSDTEEEKNNTIRATRAYAREERPPTTTPEVRPSVEAPPIQTPPSPRAAAPPDPTTPDGLLALLRAGASVELNDGRHSPTPAQVEATFKLTHRLFADRGLEFARDYWQRHRQHSDAAWRYAIQEAARRKPDLRSFNYILTIVEGNPDGEPKRAMPDGQYRPHGGGGWKRVEEPSAPPRIVRPTAEEWAAKGYDSRGRWIGLPKKGAVS
jgi:hypothetical protein